MIINKWAINGHVWNGINKITVVIIISDVMYSGIYRADTQYISSQSDIALSYIHVYI